MQVVRRKPPAQRRAHSRSQVGAVAIVVGLSLAVLIGFAGLALDLGRLYVSKSELQNAADACALAAARELTCDPAAGACPVSYLQSAELAGQFLAARNARDFQGVPVTIAADDIRFSTTLAPNSAYLPRSAGADPASRYVMCIARADGIVPWFMGVLGIGVQSVSATAVATLAPAQTNCGIPLGICSQGAAGGSPPYGLNVGQWVTGRFDSSAGQTGNFGWIDYTPPGGGASELAALLTSPGVCSLNINDQVGEAGMNQSVARAYNSRFGLYQGGGGNPNIDTAPPDFTGYSYTPTNWPSQSNALGDFLGRRNSHDSYGSTIAAGNALTGLSISNAYNPTTTPAQHAVKGADRRLVVAPIVDCSAWAGGSTTAPILAWACVLLLHPIDGPTDIVRFEYVGLSNAQNSPCATSGAVGGPGSVGPQVPALVQ
jgi:Flp pilus assembly protein TadG